MDRVSGEGVVVVCGGCRRRGVEVDAAGLCVDCATLASQRPQAAPSGVIRIAERAVSPRPEFLDQLPEPRRTQRPRTTPKPKPKTRSVAYLDRKAQQRREKRAAANPRVCRTCGGALPADAGPQRRYCDTCAPATTRKSRNHRLRHQGEIAAPVPLETLQRGRGPMPTRRAAVLEYARQRGGLVYVPDAALALGRPKANIRIALKDLGAVYVGINQYELKEQS